MPDTEVRALFTAQDNMSAAARAAAGSLGGLNLKAIAASAAVAGVAKAGYEFAQAGVNFNAEVETSTLRFERFFSSAQEAEDHVRSLTAFAAATPFQLSGITEASQFLYTFGGAALGTEENLKLVGDAAAAVNMPIEEVGMWVGRMYTALDGGRPIGEAAQRLQEMGLLSGPARQELEKLADEGAGAAAGMDALREILGPTAGGMEALSQTTSGLQSTTADLYKQVAGAWVESSGLGDLYKDTLVGLNATLTDTLTHLGSDSGGLTSVLAGAGVATVTAVSALGTMGPALSGIVPMLPMMATGFRAVWAAITGPVGLVVAAILAVGTAFYAFREQIGNILAGVIDYVADWVDSFIGSLQSAVEWIPGVGAKLSEVIDGARDSLRSSANATADWTDSWGEAKAAVETATEALGPPVPETPGPGLTGGIAAAGAAAKAATPKLDDWWKKVAEGPLHVKPSKDAMAVWTNRLVRVNEPAAVEAGQRYWAAVEAGFVGGVEQSQAAAVIPNLVGGIDHAPFSESGFGTASAWKQGFDEVVSADNIFGSIARAFEGGGGWMGGIKSVGAQVGGSLIEGLQAGTLGDLPKVFGRIGGKVQSLWTKVSGAVAAIPFAGQILAAFGPQILEGLGKIGKKVWGAIKGMFGGPSAAEQEARRIFDAFRTGAEVPLSQIDEYNRQVAEAVNAGWDRSLAEVRAKFVVMGQAAGLSHAEAFRAYERYQQAVGAGNTALMRQLEAEYGEWLTAVRGTFDDAAAAAGESTGVIVADAQEIGAAFQGLSEKEAERLGAELERLGTRAHRGFLVLKRAAFHLGAMLSDSTLPAVLGVRDALRDAARAAESLGGAMAAVPAVPGGTPPPVEHRAYGGPVSAGRPYLVGERGPELIVPRQSGTVVPSAGNTYNFNVTIEAGVDPEAAADRFLSSIRNGLGVKTS